MKVSRTTISMLGVVFLLTGAAAGAAWAVDADEIAMERRVRGLGTRIGQAYVCTEEKARETFEEEAHLLFDLIVQDVGTDLAYVYALSIGKGAMWPKKRLDCPALLKDWKEIREDYELEGDD